MDAIAKLMALAIRFEQMAWGGEVADYAELARLRHVTRARMTQIMNLLNLGRTSRCRTVASEVHSSTIRSRDRGSGRCNRTTSLRQSRQPAPENGPCPDFERRVSQSRTSRVREVTDLLPQCVPSQPCSRFA